MKYYDIPWTGKENIDEKIRSAFIHIKLKLDINYKKEVIENKRDVPRTFWFVEKKVKKFNEILKLYPDVIEYFKEHVVI